MDMYEYIMSNFDIHILLKRYDITDFSEQSNIIRCTCPIHGGTNQTAFAYNIEENLWYCHTGCKRGGNVVEFVSTMENIEYDKALTMIADIMKIPQDQRVFTKSFDPTRATHKWIQKQKDKHTSIEPYDLAQLGKTYNLNSYRSLDGDLLDKYGVRYSKELQRIVFPIVFNNQCVAVTMRTTNNSRIKWLHKPSGLNMGDILYNYDNIAVGEQIWLVEGVLDALNLIRNGIKNVVCMFGSHVTTQQAMLIMVKTYDIVLCFDNDKAGDSATTKAIEVFKNKTNIKVADYNKEKDPGDLTYQEVQEIKLITTKEWLNAKSY